MKDNPNIEQAHSFGNNSSNANTKSNITKQNTDYLFARQLSEELESTINKIQPGGKASNCDKASRNSSEHYRPPTAESNKMFEFGVTNQDNGGSIDIIGEHFSDEDQDESSNVTNSFGNKIRKDQTQISEEEKSSEDANK